MADQQNTEAGKWGYSSFISHASEDAAVAAELCRRLEERGLKCWIAPRDIPPGRDWAPEIMQGIDRSRTMIVLVSAASNRSPQVLREVSQAVSKEHPIFPILLERVLLSRNLDYFIAPIHWIQFWSGTMEEHAETLQAAIQGREDWQAGAVAPSLGRSLQFRSSVFWPALAAAALVAVATAAAVGGVLHHENQAAQARIDQSTLSLGFVKMDLRRSGTSDGQRAAPVRGSAAVYLYGADTPYSKVNLKIDGLRQGAQEPLDLSSRLNQDQVGGAQVVEFDADLVKDRLTVCLSLPHPRLGTVYRVTEAFAAKAAGAAGDASEVRLVRTAPDAAAPDSAARCGG